MCAIADKQLHSILGIDHEDIIKANLAQISDHVLAADEPSLIQESGLTRNQATTLVFSAKESLF